MPKIRKIIKEGRKNLYLFNVDNVFPSIDCGFLWLGDTGKSRDYSWKFTWEIKDSFFLEIVKKIYRENSRISQQNKVPFLPLKCNYGSLGPLNIPFNLNAVELPQIRFILKGVAI
jgi:hypothetical protein